MLAKNSGVDKASYILVIKHGALGDFIMATAAFKAIRGHHKNSYIVLITSSAYEKMANKTGFFNEVWVDNRHKIWNLPKTMKIINMLKGGSEGYNFERIYDLQCTYRTNTYYKILKLLIKGKPEWSGNAEGCKYIHNTPHRKNLHTVDRLREQLKFAGINNYDSLDVSWLKQDVTEFNLTVNNYAIIVAGGAPHRPEKRWTPEGYAAAIDYLSKRGIKSVLIGTNAEKEQIEDILRCCDSKDTISLVNRTNFAQIAELGRGAKIAIGNDTGPMHIIAPTGCCCITLFSKASNPNLTRPWGDNTKYLQVEDLRNLEFDSVKRKITNLLD